MPTETHTNNASNNNSQEIQDNAINITSGKKESTAIVKQPIPHRDWQELVQQY